MRKYILAFSLFFASMAVFAQIFEPMEMATEIQKVGGLAKFDILSGMDHPDACHKAFTA